MEPHDIPDVPNTPNAPDTPNVPDTPGNRAPAASSPLDTMPSTGNESVAAALRELAAVANRPLGEHPDAYARVHSGLQQALSDIDDA